MVTTREERASAFDLPERLHAKGSAPLIRDDELMFARVRAALSAAADDVDMRLASALRAPGGAGQQALDRDLEIRRLGARARILRRFGLDICLGRIVPVGGAPVYIGRFGLADADGARLLVDWRAPAAEPFFAASHGDPRGLSSRRRYRWMHGRIVDYWDEVFADDGVDHGAALDDQSAFIASLGASRSPKMRDVLATIQADQDAVVRAGAEGALVVEGGPGTGKTVVALHRAAYLLYADRRLQDGRGGLLFVGPHRPYIDYIDDVLPSLGEEGAVVATLAELVSGGADAPEEPDPILRRIKGDVRLADAVARAVALWEKAPATALTVPTVWGRILVDAAQWSEVFQASDSTLSHNAVRSDAWERLLDTVADAVEAAGLRAGDDARDGAPRTGHGDDPWAEGWGDATPEGDAYLDAVGAEGAFDAYGLESDEDGPVRVTLESDEELRVFFDGLWPLLDPDALLRGLWSSARMLRTCAPWLADEDIAVLTSRGVETWTDVDLPLLDVARTLVGDPRDEVRRRRARAEAAAEREIRSDVVTHLIAGDDSDMRVMSMLRGQDLRRTLAAPDAEPADPLAGPFAHIVVDEAQELTDAQWAMLVRRCPAGSFTIVGDRAQARHGFRETWGERLGRVGIARAAVSTLTIGYRTPEEVMAVAGRVIRAALPDAQVPTAIRRSGTPVRRGAVGELDAILGAWLATHDEGTAVVVGAPWFAERDRVRSLSPRLVKGLEFDLVVLVDDDRFGTGLTGAVDRYVAMTRATGQLVLLTS